MASHIEEGVFRSQVAERQRRARTMRRLYAASFGVAIVALILLVLTIANEAFGYVLLSYTVQPTELSERPLEELSEAELVAIIQERQPGQLVRLVAENLTGLTIQDFAKTPLGTSLSGKTFPAEVADLTPADIAPAERPAIFGQILSVNLSKEQILTSIEAIILEAKIEESWPLFTGLLQRAAIEQEIVEKYPDEATRPELQFRSWLRLDMFTVPMNDNPLVAGIRTAIIGTIYLVLIVICTAFPIGVMAAIYLEEYADTSKWYNRIIEINIRNLAGVPSIIYGLLGLQLFVRFLGAGRSVLAAGLTLGLLVLPVIIINAQEAIRAVPYAYREASYGLGATKWQTISRQVLPAAIPGILTGIILSLSRAIGETAPLIVVGASTFILTDPNGLLSQFTALPIQIYNWTTRPQAGFRELAAAAIIILLALLVAINMVAFIIRNRARRRLLV
jgi:phosphate transport system permease protein